MRNLRRVAFFLLIAPVFWPGSGRAATLTFGSDPSWSVYDDYPTMPGASLLGQATPYCGVIFFGCAFPALPGAQPVWAPGITGATVGDLAEFFFAKTIFIPGPPTAAEITVSVDDLAEIFVNGTSAGSLGSITDVSQSTRDPETFDISSFLQAGDNLVVVRAQNGPGSFAGCNPCTYSQNGASIVFAGEVTFTPTGCLPAPSGLVSWWPAEGSADDIAGANDGALTTGVGFTTGRVGQAFSFTSISFGGTGVVTIPHSASIDFPVTDSFTVEAWLNEAVIGGHILGKRPGGVCAGDPTGFYQMAVGDLSFPPALIGTNVWRHLAITWDGTTLRQYVDGTETDLGTYTPGSNTAPLTFGTAGNCNGFAGALDEVSVYDRALSITEIQSIFGVGSFGKCTAAPAPTSTPTSTPTRTPTFTPTSTPTETPGDSLCRITGVESLKQGASPWGSTPYDGAGQGTIAAYGCLITSAAMILNHYADIQGVPVDPRPSDIDDWLETNGWYDAMGNLTSPAGFVRYAKELGIQLKIVANEWRANDVAVDNAICGANPVILGTYISGDRHFVLATAQAGSSSDRTWLINDPLGRCIGGSRPGGTCATNTLCPGGTCFNGSVMGTTRLADSPYLDNYDRYISFMPKSLSISALAAQLANNTARGPLFIGESCGAQMLVVDSEGHRTGFDPETGQILGEIPGAAYGSESVGNFADSEADSTQPSYRFSLLEAKEGTYRVTFFGSPDRECPAFFHGFDSAQDSFSEAEATFTGVETFIVVYSAEPGPRIEVQSQPVSTPPAPAPLLSIWALAATLALLSLVTFVALRRRVHHPKL